MSYVEKVQGGSVNWGGMLAGAAVVTGAVLLAPSIVGKETITEAFKLIGTNLQTTTNAILTAIMGDGTKEVVENAGPTVFQQIGTFLQTNGAALSGAALVGGGAAGLLKSTDTAYVVPQAAAIPAATHVENEQMRAINGLMKARMMAANPEYMAQAMGRA